MGRGIVTGSEPGQRAFAGRLRERQTPAELKLWGYLRKKRLNGFRFRRQQPVRGYVVDFYCESAGLAVELDGPIHQFQVKYDLERDSVLRAAGLKVMRFRNDEVIKEIKEVVRRISEVLGDE